MRRPFILLMLAFCLVACQRGGSEAFVAPRLSPGAPARAWPPAGWAWGLLQLTGRPALRYGVSAPAVASSGDVIILPGYGESAEWWFETAGDLNREGYTVWILDGAGQGGSARFTAVRDLGHVPDFDGDVRGLFALIGAVIRPEPGRPVKVVASGTAALAALAAAERGAPIDRLILSAPAELSVGDSGASLALAKLGVKTLRARGAASWTRPDPAQSVTPRQKTALGWAVANPDLRMGGPSAGWLIARRRFIAATTAPEAVARVRTPVTIISASDEAQISCARLPRCLMHPLPARLPYHIEDNSRRAAWLSALIGELGTDHAS